MAGTLMISFAKHIRWRFRAILALCLGMTSLLIEAANALAVSQSPFEIMWV